MVYRNTPTLTLQKSSNQYKYPLNNLKIKLDIFLVLVMWWLSLLRPCGVHTATVRLLPVVPTYFTVSSVCFNVLPPFQRFPIMGILLLPSILIKEVNYNKTTDTHTGLLLIIRTHTKTSTTIYTHTQKRPLQNIHVQYCSSQCNSTPAVLLLYDLWRRGQMALTNSADIPVFSCPYNY
jgi:hypothetical protein